MRNAETVLGVLRERGLRGLPLQRLYRQLFNRELFLLAYGRIYSNAGAMTPGPTQETADGMSMAKIDTIIDALRQERYRFAPVKRIAIPKKKGGVRPLGLPSWSDKLVGEVVRLLLEAYYEPQFSGRSHGFRPQRGCHTALAEVANTWTATTWFVEADLADCFGSLDHKILLSILAERIHDNRFLRLIGGMLRAGYLEDWTWHATMSGCPQGGVASPIMSNIYLDRLDKFVEQKLIPSYTRGDTRRHNPEYRRWTRKVEQGHRQGDLAMVRHARKQRRPLPRGDPRDPGYRRLRYIRYADDHLLGFTGPKAEVEQIKTRLAEFLWDELKLTLSPDKTLITNARSGPARFLGYEITAHHDHRAGVRGGGSRMPNGLIKLRVPREVIKAKSAPFLRRGKPAHVPELINEDDYTIVATFGARYRGLVQYYLPAGNVYWFNRLEWAMRTSMLRTLAAKHRSTVSKMTARYQAKIVTPHGLRTCFEARVERPGKKPLVARFGGVPLKRDKNAVIYDRVVDPKPHRHREVVKRLARTTCEICGQHGEIEIHQIRKLADLTRSEQTIRPQWMKLMADRRRKTLAVCLDCHHSIHSG